MVQLPCRTAWRFLKTLKIEPAHDPAIPLWGIHPKGLEAGSRRDTHAPCSQLLLHSAQGTETAQAPVRRRLENHGRVRRERSAIPAGDRDTGSTQGTLEDAAKRDEPVTETNAMRFYFWGPHAGRGSRMEPVRGPAGNRAGEAPPRVRFRFCKMQRALRLDGGDGCTTTPTALSATERHTENCLTRYILLWVLCDNFKMEKMDY